jgi:hypothetical protein
MKLHYPLQQTLEFSNIILPLGDGFEQRINKNLAFVNYSKSGATSGRADGLGDTSTAYRGINHFNISMKNLTHTNQGSRGTDLSTDKSRLANMLWRFYQDRFGSFESFWFYNPAENTGDPAVDAGMVAGTDTLGRYLVRFEENNMTRDLFERMLYTAGVGLVEVRN